MLDSVVKVKKKYYTQTLLEECKYVIKKTKMESFINDELEASSSDDKSDSDSGHESDNKPEKSSKKYNNEPTNEIDNESDCEQFVECQNSVLIKNKSLIVYINHVLFGFYPCKSI